MPDDLEALIELVRDAFAGVELGDGVGLEEAQGYDDYEDAATRAAYRESDEKHDWSRITIDDLNRCNSSLSFFDDEGMRFHLPAYLIAELQGSYDFNLVFALIDINAYRTTQLSLLSEPQRVAVRACLAHWATAEGYEFERDRIETALGSHWSTPLA